MTASTRRFVASWLTYAALTFALGATWHLVLFAQAYHDLGVYSRLAEPRFELGLLAIAIQGAILAWLFPKLCSPERPILSGLRFGWIMGLFFASGTVIAEVAKQEVTSLAQWFALAGGFAALHFTLVGLALGWIHRRAR